jgi:glycosyltransferase involved in cell wall biosynthesis
MTGPRIIAFLAAASRIHTVRWVNEMTLHGDKIHLITMHPPASRDGLEKSVEVHLLPFPPPVGYFLNTWFLRRLLRTIRPHFLHTHYASGYGTLSRLSGFHPTLLSVWGSDVFLFPNESKWKKRLLRRNLQAPDYIASTSHAMKTKIEEIVGRSKPIVITPFGVDCDRFKALSEKTDHPWITIGTVKTLEPTYGIDNLIKAFAILRRRHSNIDLRLLIVGDGSQRLGLEQLAAILGVNDQTEFVGEVPNNMVPEFLNQLSIYVCLSNSESFGVAVLEASACGIPVVVSNVGGLPEVVRDGVTGFIVPKQDPDAAAKALEKLIIMPELAKSMGRSGREFVLKNYERKSVSATMRDLYQSILIQESHNVLSPADYI